jgi:hypothetical protein
MRIDGTHRALSVRTGKKIGAAGFTIRVMKRGWPAFFDLNAPLAINHCEQPVAPLSRTLSVSGVCDVNG